MKFYARLQISENHGLTKEFYEHFWDIIKDPLMNSIKETRTNKKLNISQRQAVIKLIEKRTEMNFT